MFTFSLIARILLTAVIVICLIAMAIIYFRTDARINSGKQNSKWKHGNVFLFTGIALIILSTILFFILHSEYAGNINVLQTISLMTSEPLRFASLAGIALGIFLLFTGIIFRRAIHSTRNTRTQVF